jgi:hypothetical protein
MALGIGNELPRKNAGGNEISSHPVNPTHRVLKRVLAAKDHIDYKGALFADFGGSGGSAICALPTNAD